MKYVARFTKRLAQDEKGATAIEYGLLAALISIVIIGAVSALGTQLNGTFDDIGDQLVTKIGAKTAD